MAKTKVKDDFVMEYHNGSENMNTFVYSENYKIIFVLSGKQAILFNDGYYLADSQSIVLIPKNEPHRFLNDDECEWISLSFNDKFIYQYFTDNAAKTIMKCFEHRVFGCDDSYELIRSRVYGMYKKYREKSDMLFVDIAEILMIVSELCPSDKFKKVDNASLMDVVNYITKHYDTDITIDSMAKICFISKSAFCRLFKKTIGMTPIQYLNNIRVQKAVSLLLTTKLSITEVAMRCGFSSASYFDRIFKNITGILPSEFRKKGIS